MRILDIFRYVFTEVRRCPNNTYKWHDYTLIASRQRTGCPHLSVYKSDDTHYLDLGCMKRVDSFDNINEDAMYSLDSIGQYPVWVQVMPMVKNEYCIGGRAIPIVEEFRSDCLLIERDYSIYSELVCALQNIYDARCIDPCYEKRLWTLYSFGPDYMSKNFKVLSDIRDRLWEKKVFLQFYDETLTNMVSIDDCKNIKFNVYPDRSTVLILKVSSIDVENSICTINGYYPEKIEENGTYAMHPVEVMLLEELQIEKGL